MRFEIRCNHPVAKRTQYGDGWCCDKNGCEATGTQNEGHWYPVIGFIELDEYQLADLAKQIALQSSNNKG